MGNSTRKSNLQTVFKDGLKDAKDMAGDKLELWVAPLISLIPAMFFGFVCYESLGKINPIPPLILFAVSTLFLFFLIGQVKAFNSSYGRLKGILIGLFWGLAFCLVLFCFKAPAEERYCIPEGNPESLEDTLDDATKNQEESLQANGNGETESEIFLVITEIAGNPQFDGNEFVEICNFGVEVDLTEYFLAHSGALADGSALVPWDDYPNHENFFDSDRFETASTDLQTGECGVVLSPRYIENSNEIPLYEDRMPDGIKIFTVSFPGEFLGAEQMGIVMTDEGNPSAVILFKGSVRNIDSIVSSYGVVASSARTVAEFANEMDGEAKFAASIGGNFGVYRIDCDSNVDKEEYWQPYSGYSSATPGYCK